MLRYLDFDFSEDALGHGSFDAMAAADAAQLPALQAEIVRVLDWAHAGFGEPQGLEEGGDWDYELSGVREVSTPLAALYRPGAGLLELRDAGTGQPRVTLSFTLTGSPSFCEGLREAFALA